MQTFKNTLRIVAIGWALAHGHAVAEQAPVSILLEEALFAQHVLLDDNRALELHLAILSSESTAHTRTWAESIKNAVPLLLQSGQRPKAIDLAETLSTSTNPELQPWAVWADTFLKNLRRLPLNPAPWPADEYLYFVLRTKNDAVLGFAHYWLSETEHNQSKATDLRAAYFITLNQMSNTARIIAKPIDQQWLPLHIESLPEMQMLPKTETVFDWDNFTATVTPEGGRPSILSLAREQATLDWEQFSLLPRLLNPAQATEVSLPITMQTLLATGMWQFRGTTEILLGDKSHSVEHWHGVISQPGVFNQRMELYVETSPQRLPLRFEMELFNMDLVSATVRENLHPYNLYLAGTPYSFAVPEGWVSHIETDSTNPTLAYIMAFDAKGFGFFSRRSLSAETTAADGHPDFAAILDRNIRRLTQILPNYEIHERTDSGWIATYMLGNNLMREQRKYWITGNDLYWTVAQSQADEWETIKSAFEFWMDSFSRVPEQEEASAR